MDDDDAFLAEYAGMIYHVARRFPPTTALDREDLVQLGRIGALAAWGTHDPARGFTLKSWVVIGIRREIMDAYRRDRHLRGGGDDEGRDGGHGTGVRFTTIGGARRVRMPGAFPTAAMDAARLLALASVPDRDVLTARYLRGLGLAEIAAERGISYRLAFESVRDALGRVRDLL